MASSRIEASSGGPAQVTSAGTLSGDSAAAIKKLLLEGKRDDAVQLYRSELQCDQKQALDAVQGLFERELFLDLLNKQLIRSSNIPLVVVISVVMCASLAGAISYGGVLRVAALIVFVFAFIAFPLRRLLTTFKYLGAQRATATMKKIVWVGTVKGARGMIHCANAWVEIHPKDHAPFSTSMNIVTLSKPSFVEGGQLDVKFFLGIPSSVLLARQPE